MIECPNCGSTKEPKERKWLIAYEDVETGPERITYWLCQDCDFSTWDHEDFKRQEDDVISKEQHHPLFRLRR